MSREHFDTERANERSADLDQMSVREAFDVFDAEDRTLADAVLAARDEICEAIDVVVAKLQSGGRLLYVGAGTSGRLGVLDAVECPPTFQSDPETIQGRIAGGIDALIHSIEGAEDSFDAGRAAVADAGSNDVVFGIAAGGTTPFVHGALSRAKELDAATIFLACVPFDQAGDEADISIRLTTGPEVLAGSTRLKAGTATKMVLNRITTIAMARLGKVHGNRMVDVHTTGNAKLVARAIAMIEDIAGIPRARAAALLEEAHGSVKLACVMARFECDTDEATRRLEKAGGFLREALR